MHARISKPGKVCYSHALMQAQQAGQRVVVTPPGLHVPMHRVLLSLHAGSRLRSGQTLWCSASTSEADLQRFLCCVENLRWVTEDDQRMLV